MYLEDKENRAYTIFPHPSQKWIVRGFGLDFILTLPIVPFNMGNPSAGFNTLKELGTRIAIGRTVDRSYGCHGILLAFQDYNTAQKFYECLFDIDLSAPLDLDAAPRAQTEEKKEEKREAIAALVAASRQPIHAPLEQAGILFIKNRAVVCLSPVGSP